MKKQSKSLKHSHNHVKPSTTGNSMKESNNENNKLPTDQPPLKIINDAFEFDTTPLSAFEDLTGSVKNQG